MRILPIMVLLCSAAWAQSAPAPATNEKNAAPAANQKNPALEQLKECAQKRTPAACSASKHDLKHAHTEFTRGLKLQKAGKNDQAFEAFENAARLVPRNVEYATAREIMRQKNVYDHIQAGNVLLLNLKEIAAAAEFREALKYDPNNTFALQRLQDAASLQAPPAAHSIQVVEDPGELRLEPSAEVRAIFHYRGDTRGLYQAIGAAFGVTPRFDDSVVTRPVRFDVEEVNFWTAMRLAAQMTKTFATPLSAREFLVAADTQQNRAQFERMSMRTFFVTDIGSPQELTDVVNVLRSVFEIRMVTSQPATSTVTVRAPRRLLDAATTFLESLDGSRPQVMLEFRVFEVSHSLARTIGISLPLQWQMFSLGASALAALQQPNVQDLINQLISSGGINQADTTAISALLAQLQAQSQNPLLQQPFATFGGGQTLFAVPFPPTTVNFSRNESQVSTLQHMTLRASQGNAATMRIGTRYPILNATFAPIFNTPAIAQVIQNQSFIAPFPSFNYEDLGLIVKATPQVYRNGEVRLELNIEVKALGTQSFNGVPVISNRMYTGTITVKDGESGVIAGMLQSSESNMLSGIPGVVHLPVLGTLTSNRTKQKSETELLVLVTPHVTRIREANPSLITIPSS
jgi:type II secretory pathway component GspD/PulD (secretin)